ncbi:MAG: hypothetical protein IJT30_06130 [Muribaculaceae bacterium]|nr:hypothetical protein [Muribaculaceae bacterium]
MASAADRLEYGTYNTTSHYYTYTFEYPSVDARGDSLTLSALMCFPRLEQPSANGGADGGECFNNIVIACHATITSNKECPSAFPDGEGGIGDVRLMMSYAAAPTGLLARPLDDPACRNIVVMPDYEGYGITKQRPHPYLNAELTARQTVDAVRHGLELFQSGAFTAPDDYTWATATSATHGLRNNWGTLAIGVSQGGAVAMAVQRYVEEYALDEQLRFRGAVCADGPYDPLATLRFYNTGQSYHEKDIVTLPVATAMIIKGMIDTDPLMAEHRLEDYFSPDFIRTGIFQWIDCKSDPNREMTVSDITHALYNLCRHGSDSLTAEQCRKMFPDYGYSLLHGYHAYADLNRILTPEAYDYFSDSASLASPPLHNGVMEDLHAALVRNNITDAWQPAHPLALFHSTHDTVVPIDNFLSADSAFSDHCTLYTDTTSTSDHIVACREFFITLGTAPDVKFIRLLCGYNNPDPVQDIHADSIATGDNCYYDLTGRRLPEKPHTGIYVHQGRVTIAR